MIGSLPKIWNDARVFVIGGGPSVSSLDVEMLKGKKVLVTNNAYKLVPWAQVLYFMDCVWYNWHKDELGSFKGLKVTTCNQCQKEPGVVYLKHGKRHGVDLRDEYMSRGSNSGQGGISLAAKLGATEIILLGFDMKVTWDGKEKRVRHNYHDSHKRHVPESIYEDQFMKSIKMMVSDLNTLGVRVVNCTPDSALETFPKEPLENWL